MREDDKSPSFLATAGNPWALDPRVREDDRYPSFPATTGNLWALDPRMREDDGRGLGMTDTRHSRQRPGIYVSP
jgi:hypothetical protein